MLLHGAWRMIRHSMVHAGLWETRWWRASSSVWGSWILQKSVGFRRTVSGRLKKGWVAGVETCLEMTVLSHRKWVKAKVVIRGKKKYNECQLSQKSIWNMWIHMSYMKDRLGSAQRVGSLAFICFFRTLLDQVNLNQVNIARGIDWPFHIHEFTPHPIQTSALTLLDITFHRLKPSARRRRFDECWFWISIYHDLALGTLPIRHRRWEHFWNVPVRLCIVHKEIHDYIYMSITM